MVRLDARLAPPALTRLIYSRNGVKNVAIIAHLHIFFACWFHGNPGRISAGHNLHIPFRVADWILRDYRGTFSSLTSPVRRSLNGPRSLSVVALRHSQQTLDKPICQHDSIKPIHLKNETRWLYLASDQESKNCKQSNNSSPSRFVTGENMC